MKCRVRAINQDFRVLLVALSYGVIHFELQGTLKNLSFCRIREYIGTIKMKIAVILISGFPDAGIHIAYPLRIAYLPKCDTVDIYNINMELNTPLLVHRAQNTDFN